MYHSIRFKVDEVEITDTIAMFWLVPSKEDSSVVVNTCQCEIYTGRRSSPTDRRGEPDTCKRLYINMQCVHIQQTGLWLPWLRSNTWTSLVHPLPSVNLVFLMNDDPGWVGPVGYPCPLITASLSWLKWTMPHAAFLIGPPAVPAEQSSDQVSVFISRQLSTPLKLE